MTEQTISAPGQFAARLHALADPRNRGRVAALRRGLGRPVGIPGDAACEFYRLLPADVSRHDELAYWTAATLFAAFPPREGTVIAKRRSVAAALRHLGEQQGGDDALARVERRLLQLLAARSASLATHLRGAASLLHAAGIVPDPEVLVRDLRLWGAPDQWVQRRWARDFWRVSQRHDATPLEET